MEKSRPASGRAGCLWSVSLLYQLILNILLLYMGWKALRLRSEVSNLRTLAQEINSTLPPIDAQVLSTLYYYGIRFHIHVLCINASIVSWVYIIINYVFYSFILSLLGVFHYVLFYRRYKRNAYCIHS